MASEDAVQITNIEIRGGEIRIEMEVALDRLGGNMLEKEENAIKIGDMVASILTSNSLKSYDKRANEGALSSGRKSLSGQASDPAAKRNPASPRGGAKRKRR
jgi:hypothetical protein